MNSKSYAHKSAVETGKRASLIIVVAVALTLPLRGQQTPNDVAAGSSVRADQQASAASEQTQQELVPGLADLDKRIEQISEELPMDPATFALDDGAVSSSSLGGPDPQNPQQPANGQNSGSNGNYTLKGNFIQRLAQFYSQDWAGTNQVGPSPAKRGLPAPIDSPPFPFSDWGYGGSPDIGAADGNTYP
jgi:hypothetical protein